MPTKQRKPWLPSLFSKAWRRIRGLGQNALHTAEFVHNAFYNRIFWTDSSKVQIGVMLRGGVGDVVIAARWLHSVISHFASKADIAIDIYYALPENIVFIFGKFSHIRYLYRDITFEQARRYYDFSFVINHLGYLEIDYPELEAKIANLPFADLVRSWSAGIARFSPFTTSDYHPDLGKDFYSLIRQYRFLRHSILEAQTGIPAPIEHFPFCLPSDDELKEFEQLRGKYITVHDGWDAQLRMGNRRPTKSFPREKWSTLIARIKERFPGVAVVQLGGKTGASISCVDLNLKNVIGFATAAKILQRSILHVDTDSGLVHVAASLGTRAIVLFGPTDAHYYGYSTNVNMYFEGCNNCWLKTGNWVTTCMLGDATPRCMNSIEIDTILAAVGAILNGASDLDGSLGAECNENAISNKTENVIQCLQATMRR